MSEENQKKGFVRETCVLTNIDEKQYLDICSRIITEGNWSVTRGHKIKSIFGTQSQYDLTNKTFPLLTTKKVFTRGIIEELLWFMRGDTDSKLLEARGVNIWKYNSTPNEVDKVNDRIYEICEKNHMDYGDHIKLKEEGDCGPVYGAQFRNFNNSTLPYYSDLNIYINNDWINKHNIPFGDQVANVLYELKHNPFSRRHVINLWNPLQIPFGVLPPCHMVYQFDVGGNGNPDDPDDPAHQTPYYLSLSMYQRSADFPLGVPFNIASCALMCGLFAKILGLEPRNLVHTTGNSHLYANQITVMKEQLTREPYNFPKLNVELPEVSQKKLEDGTFWKTEDGEYVNNLNELFKELNPTYFKIIGYKSHPKLEYPFSV